MKKFSYNNPSSCLFALAFNTFYSTCFMHTITFIISFLSGKGNDERSPTENGKFLTKLAGSECKFFTKMILGVVGG